jgi:hypothetical protein
MQSSGGLKRLISRWSQSRQNSCSGRAASVISVVVVPTEYLAQPITKISRQGIWNMVDERLEGGHFYRIDRSLKTGGILMVSESPS